MITYDLREVFVSDHALHDLEYEVHTLHRSDNMRALEHSIQRVASWYPKMPWNIQVLQSNDVFTPIVDDFELLHDLTEPLS
jgi:hypothetical protein